MDDRQRSARIVRNIRHEEKRLRRRFSILRHQDALGAYAVFASVAGFIGSASLYAFDVLPGWAVTVLCGFFASILHEVEHDLIHDLYFRNKRWMQNTLYWLIWILRPNTISPWARKPIHLLHHRVSGTEPDIEERLITNGMPFGLRRLLALLDGALNVALRAREINRIPGMKRISLRKAGRPMVHLFYGVILAEIALMASGQAGLLRSVFDFLIVVWVLPNVLRQFCLVFISSSMHYFGGVDSVFRQTQVLNPWFLAPLQVFCFHFGATHGIHHFVVNQPFYLREMVRRRAHAVFRKTGVHFNDLGTFGRANRYATINGV